MRSLNQILIENNLLFLPKVDTNPAGTYAQRFLDVLSNKGFDITDIKQAAYQTDKAHVDSVLTFVLTEIQPNRKLSILSYTQLIFRLENLLKLKHNYTNGQREFITAVFNEVYLDDIDYLLEQSNTTEDNLVFLAALSKQVFGNSSLDLFSQFVNPEQILNFALLINKLDYKNKNLKIDKLVFDRPTKRFIFSTLEKLAKDHELFKTKRQYWKILAHFVHPLATKNYPTMKLAWELVINGQEKPISVLNKGLDFYRDHPDVVVKNLRGLLKNNPAGLEILGLVINKLSNQDLIFLYSQLQTNDPLVLGQKSGQAVIFSRENVDQETLSHALNLIKDQLKSALSKKEAMGISYIDPKLDRVPVFKQEKTLPRFTKVDVDKTNLAFVVSGDVKDLTLSGIYLDSNWQVVDSRVVEATDKGINVAINRLQNSAIRYVAISMLGRFSAAKMSVIDVATGTTKFSSKIRSGFTNKMLVAFDVVDKKMVYIDLGISNLTFKSGTSIDDVARLAITKQAMSLGDLVRLNVQARNGIVANKGLLAAIGKTANQASSVTAYGTSKLDKKTYRKLFKKFS